MDIVIHQLNHFPVDSIIHIIQSLTSVVAIRRINCSLADSDLYYGQRYPPFEQLGPGQREELLELSVMPKNKTQRPWPGFEARLLDSESSATSLIGVAILAGQIKCICRVEP